jgi:hypothetical protein
VAVIAVAVAALGIQGGYNPDNSDIKPNRPTHIFSVRRNCHCYSLFWDACDGAVFGRSFFGGLLLLFLTTIISANSSPLFVAVAPFRLYPLLIQYDPSAQ